MSARGWGSRGTPWPGPWGSGAGEGPGRALGACAVGSHLYLLAGDLGGAGRPGWGVQVARVHHVLQQVEQQGAGVGAAVHVHHAVGAAQLEQWLALWGRGGAASARAPPSPSRDRTG